MALNSEHIRADAIYGSSPNQFMAEALATSWQKS